MTIVVSATNPSPGITDYPSLMQAVADFLNRQDLASYLPMFVQLAETRMKADLRIRPMEQAVSMATQAGVATVPLPTGYVQSRRLIIEDAPEAPLDYLSPTQFYAVHDPAIQGKPAAFTIEGENLVLGPVPNGAYTLSMGYYGYLTPLSNNNPINWLLTNFPNLYLFGSLIAAELFIQDDPRFPLWKAQYDEAAAKLQMNDSEDRHSGGALTVRSDVAL